MTPESDRVDRTLTRAAEPKPLPPELLQRISGAILPGLRPARLLPSRGTLVFRLEILCGAIGLAGALLFGMSGGKSSVYLPAIAALAVLLPLLANPLAEAMVPGSRTIAHPAGMLLLPTLILAGVFAFFLHGYTMDGFVEQGFPCLRAGLAVAAPAGIGTWLILRRGYAMDPAAAGMGAGALAGLAGVLMLSLHCPITRAVHVIVWHVAVVPVSALAGAVVAKLLTSRG